MNNENGNENENFLVLLYFLYKFAAKNCIELRILN